MASKSNEIKTRTTNPIKSFTENSVRQNYTPFIMSTETKLKTFQNNEKMKTKINSK